jgi:tetratricopeptide (TPR) repeat protein
MGDVDELAPSVDDRLAYAKVLVELGELVEAEREVAELLDDVPDELTSLNLFAKIKHMKGELSQAVACWAQLHTRSPHNERTVMALASMLELAKSPERSAGEFLAFGHDQLLRKPAAHLELEEVFRLYLARRPDEARAACDRLALKYRGKDRELFKTAIMAKAWIAELCGELELACVVLEELGRERGFETDTDRVLSLARVYEKIGSPARLERAVHIFRYLDRSFEKLTALSRLGAIWRKLGNEAAARDYDEKYERAFRRRMHRPDEGEIVRAAASRFLPLGKLRSIVASDALDADATTSREAHARHPREGAIAAALRGALDVAEELFTACGELLDRKYLAELALLRGDAPSASEKLLACIAEDPSDVRLVQLALGDARVVASEAAQTRLRDRTLRARVASALDGALRGEPLRAATWRARAELHAMADEHAEARRCFDRADALDEAAARDTHAVGRVLAAAVYHFVGKAKGLVHQIWADRKPATPGKGGFLHPDDILGNVTPEMRQGIRNAFFAVREYARSRFPEQTSDILDYDYTYKVTKEDEPSGGLSAGLPTALAFLSVFLQRPVPQDMAFSGVLIADAHDALAIRRVGEAEYKVKAAYNRNLRRILLPRDNRVDILGNPHLPGRISGSLVRYVASLDEAVTLTWGDGIWTA